MRQIFNDSTPKETDSPQGRIESIDFAKGSFSGWIEVRNDHIPHLQIREGDVLRSTTSSLGGIRRDVSSVKHITAKGFTVSAGRPVSPNDVQNGTTAVHALWELEDYPLPIVASCRERVGKLVDLMPLDLKSLRGNFSHVNAPVGTRVSTATVEMSSFEIPVGTTSGDGVTTVGNDGNLFLRGGGNSLEVQYSWGKPHGPQNGGVLIEKFAAGWKRVFDERARTLSSLGIPYRQVMIPEKNSVLSDMMPLSTTTPTPLYRALLKKIEHEAWFLDTLAMFRAWDESVSPSWMKVDSHFTAQAALALTQKLLTDLKLGDQSLLDSVKFGADFEFLRGDMGWRLVGFDLYDRLALPDESTLAALAPKSDPVSVIEPSNGGHIGTRISWANGLAPIDAHVLVFGNSYFGKGRKPNQMSWWFSRLFKRFTLVWDPDVNIEIVNDVSPDAVICQTVERFLSKVPTT